MWPTKEDFRIQAENFDPTNGLNILRIICGLFLFPHVMGKFAAGTVSAATVGFFAKAGFHPPEVWAYIAAISETAVGVALVLGICEFRRRLYPATLLHMSAHHSSTSRLNGLKQKQGAAGITTAAPYVAGQWGRGDDRLLE
jgi:DoxX-like protein